MKTRQFILTVMAALIVSSPMMAQSRIDKIVDELEQKGVDVSKVIKRDSKTKKPYSIVRSLTFYSKDSNYANRLKEAFKKDAEEAVEEKVERKGSSYLLIFIDGKKKSTYSLNIQDRKEKDPRVDLKIIMRDGNIKELDKFDGWLDNFGTQNIDFNFLNGQLDSLGKMNFDKFGRDMEKWGEDFSRQMEKFGKELEKSKKKEIKQAVEQTRRAVEAAKSAKKEAVKKAEEQKRRMKDLKNKT